MRHLPIRFGIVNLFLYAVVETSFVKYMTFWYRDITVNIGYKFIAGVHLPHGTEDVAAVSVVKDS